MPQVLSPSSPDDADPEAFPETRWTLIQRIQGEDLPAAEIAIRELCAIYGPPLYAHADRKYGQAGRDMVNSFLQGFLRQKAGEGPLRKVEAGEGSRLRHFMLACFKKHALTILKRDKTGQRVYEAASFRQQIDTPEEIAADMIFHRDWARLLVDRVLSQMQAEWDGQGRGDFFRELIRRMREGREETTYVQLADDFGMKDATVRKRAFRVRKRFQELFRREVRQTVETDAEVDEEIAFLMDLLSRR